MVEEETLERGPKGGGKEELGKEEWISLNTLSLKKTKIDKITQLPWTQERRREGVFVCFGMEENEVYIVVVEKIWLECHLMRVDKESLT